MEERKNNKDTVLLTVIGIATLLVAIVGATFAFFTARITDNDNSKSLTITSSSGGTTVWTGGEPIVVENIYPKSGAWAVKNMKITYTNQSGTAYPYTYALVLNYNSSFNSNQIKYTFAPVTTSYCSNANHTTQDACVSPETWTEIASGYAAATPITGYFQKSSGSTLTVQLGTGTIAAGTTAAIHEYTLTIEYPDSGANQNYAQGDGSTPNGEIITDTTNQGQSLTAWVSATETSNS